MKHPPFFSFLLFTSICLSIAAPQSSDASSKMNIILIYTDDHDWADLGGQGITKTIRTPHFDQLANDVVRFCRGYVSATQFESSRRGLMTVCYQRRLGVEDNNKGPLPLSERAIADQLKPVGYLSVLAGKLYLDSGGQKGGIKSARILSGYMPHHRGFAEYFRLERRQNHASQDLYGKPFADALHLVIGNRKSRQFASNVKP